MNIRIAHAADAARGLVTGSRAHGRSFPALGFALARPLAFGLAIASAFSSVANAQTDTDTTGVTGGLDPATMLLNVTNFILGPFGQTLGVIGIIGIGMAWMFGRASLGLVAGVIGGIVIMFGAGFLGHSIMG